MPPAYVGGSQVQGTSATTSPPQDASPGDLLVAQAFRGGSSSIPSLASGWTSDLTGTVGGGFGAAHRVGHRFLTNVPNGYWNWEDGTTQGWGWANGTIANQSAQAKRGTLGLKLTANGAGAAQTWSPYGSGPRAQIPDDTKDYMVSFWVRSSVLTRAVFPNLHFLDSNGTEFSQIGLGSMGLSNVQWNQFRYTFNPPTGTAMIALNLYYQHTDGSTPPNNGDIMYLDEAYFTEVVNIGTWTGSSELQCHAWSGVNAWTPVGATSQAGVASTQVNYAAATLQRTDGSSSVMGMATSRFATDMNAKAVTGMTTRSQSIGEIGSHSVEGVSSFSSSNYTTLVNDGNEWLSATVEVIGDAYGPVWPRIKVLQHDDTLFRRSRSKSDNLLYFRNPKVTVGLRAVLGLPTETETSQVMLWRPKKRLVHLVTESDWSRLLEPYKVPDDADIVVEVIEVSEVGVKTETWEVQQGRGWRRRG